jgi:hypothetical protein
MACSGAISPSTMCKKTTIDSPIVNPIARTTPPGSSILPSRTALSAPLDQVGDGGFGQGTDAQRAHVIPQLGAGEHHRQFLLRP